MTTRTPNQDETRQAKLAKNLEKARAARAAKRAVKQEKIDAYNKAVSDWLATYRPLPDYSTLMRETTPAKAKKLKKHWETVLDAQAKANRLVTAIAKARRNDNPKLEDLESQLVAAKLKIQEARDDFNAFRRTLAGKRAVAKATLKCPVPTDFDLTYKDVKVDAPKEEEAA